MLYHHNLHRPATQEHLLLWIFLMVMVRLGYLVLPFLGLNFWLSTYIFYIFIDRKVYAGVIRECDIYKLDYELNHTVLPSLTVNVLDASGWNVKSWCTSVNPPNYFFHWIFISILNVPQPNLFTSTVYVPLKTMVDGLKVGWSLI